MAITDERSIREDRQGDLEEVPQTQPQPQQEETAAEQTEQQGKIQDDPYFRDLDRETQKWIEQSADPWAALEEVRAGGGPKVSSPDSAGEPAAAPAQAPASPTEGAARVQNHLVSGSETGQTFERSFAQPGTQESRIFAPRERLNLFRSLPQFRAMEDAQQQGGMRFVPEYSPSGGSYGIDYGAAEAVGKPGGLTEDELRAYILRKMF